MLHIMAVELMRDRGGNHPELQHRRVIMMRRRQAARSARAAWRARVAAGLRRIVEIGPWRNARSRVSGQSPKRRRPGTLRKSF